MALFFLLSERKVFCPTIINIISSLGYEKSWKTDGYGAFTKGIIVVIREI